MSVVRVPSPLRPYTQGQKEVEVRASSVSEALLALSTAYPDLRRHLLDEDGSLRTYVNIFVNQEDIRSLDGVNTLIKEGDQVMILPSIAGGANAPISPIR